MKIEYKEYVIIQSNYNNHVTIYKNGDFIFHASVNEKLTQSELISLLNLIIRS